MYDRQRSYIHTAENSQDNLCSNYLYWQYLHHFIEKVDSFWPPKIAHPESFNM